MKIYKIPLFIVFVSEIMKTFPDSLPRNVNQTVIYKHSGEGWVNQFINIWSILCNHACSRNVFQRNKVRRTNKSCDFMLLAISYISITKLSIIRHRMTQPLLSVLSRSSRSALSKLSLGLWISSFGFYWAICTNFFAFHLATFSSSNCCSSLEVLSLTFNSTCKMEVLQSYTYPPVDITFI